LLQGRRIDRPLSPALAGRRDDRLGDRVPGSPMPPASLLAMVVSLKDES
jgi:hypothetical protein